MEGCKLRMALWKEEDRIEMGNDLFARVFGRVRFGHVAATPDEVCVWRKALDGVVNTSHAGTGALGHRETSRQSTRCSSNPALKGRRGEDGREKSHEKSMAR